MMVFRMLKTHNKTNKGFSKIIIVGLLVIVGCVAPLLVIHFETAYPRWQPFGLEALGLSGLCLIFAQSLLKR